VKQVPLDDDEAAVAMQRELKALRALRHPNVVALLGALTDDDEGLLWAILEFAPHGSLHRMLHRSSESDMRACFGDAKALPGLGEAFWGVAADVCAALAFLHRRSVIHGDVKAANVLLGNGGVAKISDFGLARVVGTCVESNLRRVRIEELSGAPDTLVDFHTGRHCGFHAYVVVARRHGGLHGT
jgi:serine/threonine protein kinase